MAEVMTAAVAWCCVCTRLLLSSPGHTFSFFRLIEGCTGPRDVVQLQDDWRQGPGADAAHHQCGWVGCALVLDVDHPSGAEPAALTRHATCVRSEPTAAATGPLPSRQPSLLLPPREAVGLTHHAFARDCVFCCLQASAASLRHGAATGPVPAMIWRTGSACQPAMMLMLAC